MLRLLRKPLLYLDTSVPSAYYDDSRPERQAATVHFWERLDHYQPHISALVIRELLLTPDVTQRVALAELAAGMTKLKMTREAKELAVLYVEEGIVPEEYSDDAVHLAVATAHNMDYVVSWNFEHLVNVRTRQMLNAVNTKCGYRTLDVVAPPEL